MSELRIDSDDLRAHSNRVLDIASGVRSAAHASDATPLGGGAFGLMCSFMVPPLSMVKSVSDQAIQSSASAVERVGDAIGNVADQFDECDCCEAKNYKLLARLLGGK